MILLAAYLALVLLLYLGQRRIMYLPERLPENGGWTPPEPFQMVGFGARDGTRITGLWCPPPRGAAHVLLITHGNAGNVRSWAELLRGYQSRGFGGLLLDPRGYGRSEGSPTEEGWILDGEAALAFLLDRGYPPDRVVAHGVSIGSGITVALAARHELAGLVLQSAFTDTVRLAQRLLFFVPCGLVVKDTWRNLERAAGVRCPVLLIHGDRDRTVPIDHGRALASALGTRATLREAAGYGHNDLIFWDDYWPTLAEFISGLR